MPRPEGPWAAGGVVPVEESVVPAHEDLPIFEEQDLPPANPDPVARVLLDGRSPAGRNLRLLARRLQALGRDRRLRRLGVVSAREGEGRSSVALGIARALAEEERWVLLLEMDLSHPAVDDFLSYPPPEVGLRRYLADDRLAWLTVRRPGRESLWVLSTGRPQRGAEEALLSPRLGPLLVAAERAFDHVVVDCPDLSSGPGADSVQDELDGLVFVVREGHASREAVQRAARMLRPGKLCGYVMNFSRRSPRG